MATSRSGVADLQPEQGLNGHCSEEQRKHDNEPIDQHGIQGSHDAVRIAAQQPDPKRVATQPAGQERIQERHGVEDPHHGPDRHRQLQRAQDRMPADGGNRDLGDQDAESDGQPALPAFEQARQDTKQIVFVEDEPYAAGRDHQLHAEGQRLLRPQDRRQQREPALANGHPAGTDLCCAHGTSCGGVQPRDSPFAYGVENALMGHAAMLPPIRPWIRFEIRRSRMSLSICATDRRFFQFSAVETPGRCSTAESATSL